MRERVAHEPNSGSPQRFFHHNIGTQSTGLPTILNTFDIKCKLYEKVCEILQFTEILQKNQSICEFSFIRSNFNKVK